MKSFSLERGARRLATQYGFESICVTAGSRGAGLLQGGEWCWEEGRSVSVVDTVGAGDAFLGALLSAQLFREEDGRTALFKACRLAEFVASRSGATPPYHLDELGRIRSL